jgi:hypothetical protein
MEVERRIDQRLGRVTPGDDVATPRSPLVVYDHETRLSVATMTVSLPDELKISSSMSAPLTTATGPPASTCAI